MERGPSRHAQTPLASPLPSPEATRSALTLRFPWSLPAYPAIPDVQSLPGSVRASDGLPLDEVAAERRFVEEGDGRYHRPMMSGPSLAS